MIVSFRPPAAGVHDAPPQKMQQMAARNVQSENTNKTGITRKARQWKKKSFLNVSNTYIFYPQNFPLE